jgi:hypothetical protein
LSAEAGRFKRSEPVDLTFELSIAVVGRDGGLSGGAAQLRAGPPPHLGTTARLDATQPGIQLSTIARAEQRSKLLYQRLSHGDLPTSILDV